MMKCKENVEKVGEGRIKGTRSKMDTKFKNLDYRRGGNVE